MVGVGYGFCIVYDIIKDWRLYWNGRILRVLKGQWQYLCITGRTSKWTRSETVYMVFRYSFPNHKPNARNAMS